MEAWNDTAFEVSGSEITVDKIFDNPPAPWLRGDPFLWDDMKEHFAGKPFPYEKEQFISDFNAYFLEICNSNLENDQTTYVPRYAANLHGGMSSGMICHDFWIKKGLPLLLDRLEYCNTNTGTK